MTEFGNGTRRLRWFGGITFRVALLAWTVTLVTLAVFVFVILPQQESEFKHNLESKARGVAASIKAVAAGAAVSEDYSVVVDQAMQVLSGDEAIDYVVITKNDGFSVLTDRANWRVETLDQSWRPAKRVPTSLIGANKLFGRRVFHYATPFDYSGVEWGWVHIGLSLKDYDQSVQASYRRTLELTLFCTILSLLFSLAYAQRLVKPIHILHAAVEKVAQGDLATRADVGTRDEIGELARAFNSMTGAILARNRILESVGFAAQELLRSSDGLQAMKGILDRVGTATLATRAHVCENEERDGTLWKKPREYWVAPGFAGCAEQVAGRPWQGEIMERWAARLANNELVTAQVSKLDEHSRSVLDPEAKSLIWIPILVGDVWWGVLGFEDFLQEREWSEAEKDSLRAVGNMLGSTLMRRRAQAALVEANNTLERRVVERTRELQEQVVARERANEELAAAQQRLVDMSRQAGMAEVATGVLHNVGNVLNSVNVAATLVLEKVQHSRIDKLASVAGMLEEHREELGPFLRTDEKGSRIVPYLAKLADHLTREREGMLTELGNLSRHVGHIKEIVAAQQGFATTSGFVEPVCVRKLMEDALALSRDGLTRHGITLELNVADIPEVLTDKHKVLQIVLNLIRNAKDAVRGMPAREKNVRLGVRQVGEDEFEIVVADNGVGLTEEHLQRIFQHGFTTKPGGHGFGLHSGALAAKDLGGRLTVHSEGAGKGAVFALRLPLRTSAKEEKKGVLR